MRLTVTVLSYGTGIHVIKLTTNNMDLERVQEVTDIIDNMGIDLDDLSLNIEQVCNLLGDF